MAKRNIAREIINIKIAKVNISRKRAYAVHKISMEKARIMRSKIKIAKYRLAIAESQLGKHFSSNIHLNSYNIPPNDNNVREDLKSRIQKFLTLPTAKSLTPILTVSEEYLHSESLWGNMIRLSQMIRQKDSVSYNSTPIIGDNLHGMISSNNVVDVSKIPNQFLLMLGNLADWKVNGELPEDIVTYSLSNTVGIDDYLVVMLASNKSRTVQKKAHWSDEHVQKLTPLFNRTVIGNGKKHHRSVGKYLGMGTTAKYIKWYGIIWEDCRNR